MRRGNGGGRVLLLFSGGLDSTLASWLLARDGYEVAGLIVDSDARPTGERNAATRLVARLGFVDTFVLRVEGWSFARRAREGLVGGWYEGYIPYRNLVLWALAASTAAAYGFECVAAGHTREDAQTFNDASVHYFAQLTKLLSYPGLTGGELDILVPLATLSDADCLSFARTIPKEVIDETWSCWRDDVAPCRQCFACQERDRFLANLASSP